MERAALECSKQPLWKGRKKVQRRWLGGGLLSRQTGINFPRSPVPLQTVDTPRYQQQTLFYIHLHLQRERRVRRVRREVGMGGGSADSQPYQISHFFYPPRSHKLSLSWPLLCVLPLPFALLLTFSLPLPLSLSRARSLSLYLLPSLFLPPLAACDPSPRLCRDFLSSAAPFSFNSAI